MVEAYLKNYFKFKNISGEWFDLSYEDIDKIERLIVSKEKSLDVLNQRFLI